MTYHGVVLLLSGYQADEQHILRQYRAIVDKCVILHDSGTLAWLIRVSLTGFPRGIQMARYGSSTGYDSFRGRSGVCRG